jgi:hypothetical protein
MGEVGLWEDFGFGRFLAWSDFVRFVILGHLEWRRINWVSAKLGIWCERRLLQVWHLGGEWINLGAGKWVRGIIGSLAVIGAVESVV